MISILMIIYKNYQ